MSYRHFVFDLDGTLIDSRQDLADAANVMLATYDAAPLPAAAVVAMVGEGARVLVQRVLASAGVDDDPDRALSRFLAAYDDRLVATTRPYDEVIETLECLHRHARISVLTNKPQAPSDRVIDALALRPYVDAIIGGDTVFGRKPAPEALRRLMQDSGVPEGATLLVGDSWVDVATARAGGIDVCLVTYGFGYDAADAAHRQSARWTIDHMSALLSLHPSSRNELSGRVRR